MQLHVGLDMGDSQTYEDLIVNIELSFTAKFAGEEVSLIFFVDKKNEPEMNFSPLSEENRTCKLVYCSGTHREITVPETVSIDGKDYTVTEIGDNVFDSKTRLERVTLPASITKIGNGAFLGCTSLSSINFPGNLEVIGDDAFKSCGHLTIPQLPDRLSYIGNEAFSSTWGCISMTVPGTLYYVGKECFKNCRINNIEFLDNESSIRIHNDAFDNVSDLCLKYLGRNIDWEGGEVMPFICNETLILGETLTDMSWFKPVEVQRLRQIISNTMTPPSIDRLPNSNMIISMFMCPHQQKRITKIIKCGHFSKSWLDWSCLTMIMRLH